MVFCAHPFNHQWHMRPTLISSSLVFTKFSMPSTKLSHLGVKYQNLGSTRLTARQHCALGQVPRHFAIYSLFVCFLDGKYEYTLLDCWALFRQCADMWAQRWAKTRAKALANSKGVSKESWSKAMERTMGPNALNLSKKFIPLSFFFPSSLLLPPLPSHHLPFHVPFTVLCPLTTTYPNIPHHISNIEETVDHTQTIST